MGWVRKLEGKDGRPRWRAEYRAPDRKIKSAGTFGTERAAKRAAEGQELRKEDGSWVDPSRGRATLAEWFRGFMEAHEGDHSAGTRAWYMSRWTRLEPELGHRAVASISRKDAELAERRIRAAHGESAARAARRALVTLLQFAVDDDVIARNPARRTRQSGSRRQPSREMRYLSHQELAEVVAAAPDRDRALVLLLGLGGLRIGEALGLQVQDVDLLRRRVSVTKAAAEVGGKVTIGPTKTGKARSVPVPAVVAEAIAAHLEDHSGGPEALLFPDTDGGPMRRSNWRRRVWVPALRRAGIAEPLPRVHDLRHTAAALAIQTGAHPKAIMDMLGHSSITMTLDRYGHLFPSLAEQLAERLDEAHREALAVTRTQVR
jgi:integrase